MALRERDAALSSTSREASEREVSALQLNRQLEQQVRQLEDQLIRERERCRCVASSAPAPVSYTRSDTEVFWGRELESGGQRASAAQDHLRRRLQEAEEAVEQHRATIEQLKRIVEDQRAEIRQALAFVTVRPTASPAAAFSPLRSQVALAQAVPSPARRLDYSMAAAVSIPPAPAGPGPLEVIRSEMEGLDAEIRELERGFAQAASRARTAV